MDSELRVLVNFACPILLSRAEIETINVRAKQQAEPDEDDCTEFMNRARFWRDVQHDLCVLRARDDKPETDQEISQMISDIDAVLATEERTLFFHV
jgi:hypothetical protein